MLAAKASVNFIEKIAPTAVKALGKAGVAEMALLAGGVAEGLDLLLTPIVKPMADKAGDYLKNKIQEKAANKQQKLLDKKAAYLAQKAQKENAEVAVAETQTEEVAAEEAPKTSNKKNKK